MNNHDTIKVNCVDYGLLYLQRGTTISEAISALAPITPPPLAAVVNGLLQELDYQLMNDSEVNLVNVDSDLGRRIYRRSLVFCLLLACRKIFPEKKVWISHSLGDGLFGWMYDDIGRVELSTRDVKRIETEMLDIIDKDLPLNKIRLSLADAIEFFSTDDHLAKAKLLAERKEQEITVYSCEDYRDYLHGRMALQTGVLGDFRLIPFENAFILELPVRSYLGCQKQESYPATQLQTVLNDYNDWSELLGIRTVSDLNEIIRNGGAKELILIAETLQERVLHHISDAIYHDFPQVRLVLIAGPSSSGKTTSTQRLKIQFRTLGIKCVEISLDDYFHDRDKTPLNELGRPDFEGLGALDLELFNQNLSDLLAGREVTLPRYDFLSGTRAAKGRQIRIADDQIILVEGIHALNEVVSASIPAENKRKIYISCLTQLNFDEHTPISTSDNRMFRRMTRDMQFRNITPEKTIAQWLDVRRGEHKNIFPYQEQADYFFNSSLIYELSVLRPLIEEPLKNIGKDSPGYREARRLIRFISSFAPIDPAYVPANSILKEFLGGSIFAEE